MGKLYSSRTALRLPSGSKDIDPQSLTDTILRPMDAYSPRLTDGMTRAPEPLPPNSYIKRPSMLNYDPVPWADQHVLRDIVACELLINLPHNNLATYYGCEVSKDGRVVGLCFEAYRETLMEKVNPGHLNKQSPPQCNPTAADSYVSAIRSGIQHIHSLGLAHNDLNPSNIVFDKNDKAVIIDFDSCLPFGSALGTVKRTPGWFNPESEKSGPENDLNAISEINAWLHGAVEKYRFF